MINNYISSSAASFMFCTPDCREEFYSNASYAQSILGLYDASSGKMIRTFTGCAPLFFLGIEETSLFDINYKTISQTDLKAHIYKIFSAYYISNGSFSNLEAFSGLVLCHSFYPEFLFNTTSIYMAGTFLVKTVVDGSLFSTFYLLINSSCAPNMDYVIIGDKIVFFIRRAVKANKQLFCGYG
jgi:hypothetical protein